MGEGKRGRGREDGGGGSRGGSVLPQHLRCSLQSTTIREGDGRGKEGEGRRGGRERERGEERGGSRRGSVLPQHLSCSL